MLQHSFAEASGGLKEWIMESMKSTVLVADDEERTRKILDLNLKDKYRVLLARSGGEAIELLGNNVVHLLLTDMRMPEKGGMDVLQYVQRHYRHIPVIVVTAYGSVENAVQAMKNGAYDYIVKPIKLSELQKLIEKALNYARLLSENVELKEKLKKYEASREIITANPQMQALLEMLKHVADTTANVLIEGESGTGKQLAAEYIHHRSARADNPFIEINCGAIPEDLLESELFGHEKGAFTGAVYAKKGKFELADEGTIFLDEIGELPMELQVKLLHVIENQKFTRVGGTDYIRTNARIIAATNRRLSEEIKKNNFRSDLYYRLKVIYLEIPPLRERREDIPILARKFAEKYGKIDSKEQQGIELSDGAVNILQSYNWPGNVRELENIIQQAVFLARDGRISDKTLPRELLENNVKPSMTKEELRDEKNRRTESIIRELESGFLKRVLRVSGGNITRASEISGYDRRQIQNLIKKHGISAEGFK